MINLSELLDIKYKKSNKHVDISEVYGIIYRIYCIPENKSYIGQTFSHHIPYKRNYYSRFGIVVRCRCHYNQRAYVETRDRPLYKALNTYPSNQFIVYTECKVEGMDLANINQIEGEYMQKYNSLHPNGYNTEKVGKSYGKTLEDLAEYHGFTINRFIYQQDNTRSDRSKDVCVGVRFGLKRQEVNKSKILACLKTIEIESVSLMETKGKLRILVREKESKDYIRIYFQGTKEECLTYAKQIHQNVIIKDSFSNKYEHQSKLDLVLSMDVAKLTEARYENKSNGAITYTLSFYADGGGSLNKISFGGKSTAESVSREKSNIFLDKFITEHKSSSDIEYKLLVQ